MKTNWAVIVGKHVVPVLWLAALGATAAAQTPPSKSPAPVASSAPKPTASSATPAPVPAASPATQAAPAFVLTVTPQRVVTVDAKEVKCLDLAKALARELKTPVHLSPLIAGRVVTVKMTKAPIENLLLAMAPQVFIDYEVRWDQAQEAWVGVELTGFNEREPRTLVEPKAFLVLAGSTDEETTTPESMAKDKAATDEEKLNKETKEESVLDVAVKDGLVSVRARKQMAAAIVLDAASKAGIGFETRGVLDQTLIDFDVRATPFEQLPTVLARPDIGVLMRRNLATGGTRAVAVLLGKDATHVPTQPASAEVTTPGRGASPRPARPRPTRTPRPGTN